MKCYLCKAKAKIKMDRDMCENCFCRLFEKRVRKYARENKLFRPKDKVLVIGEINKYLVESIVKNLPIELYFRNKIDSTFIKSKKLNKIVIEWSLEDEINEFLKKIMLKKTIKKDNKIRLLKIMSEKQIKEFARIKKLKYKVNKKNAELEKMIKRIDEKYPNAKFNLIKNIEILKKIKKF